MADKTHTFVIAAYKESEFLEELIKSLLAQTVKSKVVIATSTSNDHIGALAEKYDIPVFVNRNENAKTISGDFSFALQCADTDFVTIAHQDDIYEPDYTQEILKKADGRKSVILFTGYYEIRGGERVYKNKLLNTKKFMNFGFKLFPKSKFVRKKILSFGCPICCPSVTYPKSTYESFKFSDKVTQCVDWEAWLRLMRRDGEFLYIDKPLMGHRVHENSTTTMNIADNSRYNEELAIYKQLWPDRFAEWLIKRYNKASESNELK